MKNNSTSVTLSSLKITTSSEHTARVLPVQEMRSKAEVLEYNFPPLIERLRKELNLSQEDAHGLFRDMLMFLYICGVNTSKRRYSPPKMIDEAWHSFILFTKEYEKFCREHFGRFLHHNPFTKANRKALEKQVTPVIPVARQIFGELSSNWRTGPKSAICDCEGNCGCP